MRKFRRIYLLVILLVLIASGIWTYENRNSGTLIVSYIVDSVLFLLLVYLLTGKSRRTTIKVDPKDYKEWITEGSVDKNNRLKVNIFTLEDLVKVAVDSDTRVIHDVKLNKYFVFLEDVAYVYDPPYIDQVMEGKQQIGKILLDRGLITSQQIETGLYYQKRVGSRLGDSLVALGFIDETTLYSTLAAQQKMAYYELDAKMEPADTSWLSVLSINKARALQVLPLGHRSDGKLVIACGESAWAGIHEAIKEIFGPDIYIVASPPSRIYEILEILDDKIKSEKIKNSFAELLKEHKLEPYERLSEEETEQFVKSYQKGKLDIYLLIKSLGVTNSVILSQTQDKDAVLGLLTSKNQMNGETANLIMALNKVIKKQEAKDRQDKVMPGLLELLKEAYYITADAAEWVNKEVAASKKSFREVLESNYLVSKETIEQAASIIEALKKLTVRAKVY
ncbi:MAG TPA: DUF5305 family protein [Mobilitalea sp.]|nr:DUF5305 family protein [Mobilitalea sp.]